MIQAIKIKHNDFEMSEIMGNIFHLYLFGCHFRISSYRGGFNMSFSRYNMYELEYVNLKKRPDLKPKKQDQFYEIIFRI